MPREYTRALQGVGASAVGLLKSLDDNISTDIGYARSRLMTWYVTGSLRGIAAGGPRPGQLRICGVQ